MSGQSRDRRKRTSRSFTGHQVDRLEGRALLASIAEFGVTMASHPTLIVTGADGNLWFTEPGVSKIGRITTGGVVTEFSLTAGRDPEGITAGPDGALWFTESSNDRIGRITTTGTITEYALSSESDPQEITTGPDGNLWFTELGTNQVAEIVPSGVNAGTITEFALPGGSNPQGITSGPDGNLWFTESGSNKVAKIVPSGVNAGTITQYSLSPSSGPEGITTGSDGNLWFTENVGNRIGKVTPGGSVTEYSVPGSNYTQQQIVSGPLGDLYFTEANGNSIGQLTTDGAFTLIAVPTSGSNATGITLGPDNHVWFTELAADQIGRLNLGPIAVDDSYSVVDGTTLTTTAATGLLANDSEPEGDTFGFSYTPTSPSHGSISFNGDGSFAYTPDPGYSGPDSFTYADGDFTDFSNIATVTFNVLPDTPPVAVNDSYSATTSTPLTVTAAFGVQANDTDAENDELASYVVANPAHGTLSFNADGSFTYIPDPGTHGTDTFTYKDNDGNSDGNTATVTITIDAAPVAVNDSYTTVRNTALTVGLAGQGLLANDTDADGDPLTAVVVGQPSHGTLALNADGTFTYTPNLNYFGLDTFTYAANDGFVTGNTATVNVRVDAPPVAVADSYTAIANTTLTRSVAQGVLVNDTDADGDQLFVGQIAGALHGTLSLHADGSFVYTPTAGYHGPDSFTYQDTDGTATSSIVTVSLTVDAPPVAVADHYTTDAGTGLAVTLPANGVLANDTDADGDPITAIAVTQPANGTLFLFASGLNANGTFTYYPNIGFTGTDSFTYKVNDGTVDGNTVTVTITVNPLPVAANDSYQVPTNGTLIENTVGGVLANDTGTGTLDAVAVEQPAHGTLTLNADGSFTYIPTLGYSGPDSFTYKVNDGISDSNTATVTLTVTPNHAPVAVGDNQVVGEGGFTSVAPGLLANDTDADGDPLTALLVAGPSHGTLAFHGDGSYTYTPNAGFGSAGSDTFTYRAFDGSLASNVATVTLTFDGTYLTPVAQTLAYTVAQDGTLTVAAPGLLAGASDYWSLPLTAIVIAPPTHGTLAANADGSFTYTPAAGYSGPDGFTYEANNGHVSGAAQAVSISVAHVNHPPVSVNDSFSTTAGQPPLAVAAGSGVLANDTDADGDPLTAILVNGPDHGLVILNADGSFTYIAAAGYSGPDGFTYEAFDGQSLGNIASVGLTVHAAPPPPPAVPGDYDGDGKADVAVYIPSIGAFDIRFSGGSPEQLIRFGTPGDGNSIPAPGDYDHSGRTELAVYITASGKLIYRPAGTPGAPDVVTQFGSPGLGQAVTAPGDYYGTGQADVAAYMPSSGTYAILDPTGQTLGQMIQFGSPGLGNSIPVPGDYYGTGRDDIAVYLPQFGAFAIKDPTGQTPGMTIPFGMPGRGNSIPMPGDYDGSGKTELAVYVPSLGAFFYRPAGGGADVMVPFGTPGAGQTLPSPGDYTGVGHDELAAYLPASGTFAIQVPGVAVGPQYNIGLVGLGQSIPATVVDQALAEMPPIVSGLSISIPDLQFPAHRKKNG